MKVLFEKFDSSKAFDLELEFSEMLHNFYTKMKYNVDDIKLNSIDNHYKISFKNNYGLLPTSVEIVKLDFQLVTAGGNVIHIERYFCLYEGTIDVFRKSSNYLTYILCENSERVNAEEFLNILIPEAEYELSKTK